MLISLQCGESKHEGNRKSTLHIPESISRAKWLLSLWEARPSLQGDYVSPCCWLALANEMWVEEVCVTSGWEQWVWCADLLFLWPKWQSMFQMELAHQTCAVSERPVLWGCYCSTAFLVWPLCAIPLDLWIFFPHVINTDFLVKYFKKFVMNSNPIYICMYRYVCTCVCVCTVVSDFVTLWTVAHQAPLSMEFSRQECWSQLPFPTPGDLPDPGVEPKSPALAGGFCTTEPPGKPPI